MQQPIKEFHKIQYVCLAILLLVGLFSFLSWPISGSGDTDLWYHMNSGRYFFTHHQIADHGFFSFHGHDRYWVNYYWLFQLLVYQLFSLFDYPGLIVLRSIAYLATTLAIAFVFLRDRKSDSEIIYFAALVAIYFCSLYPRYFVVVRPHMASYLFIPVAIILMEARNRRWLYLLPALVLLWVNLHGIEYPVIMVLCGSYLLEAVYDRFGGGGKSSMGLTPKQAGMLLLAMAAVFINPFGWALLKTPFQMAPDLKYYIGDMQPLAFSDLVQFDFSNVTSIYYALSNSILLLALLSCLRGCWTRTIRVSHLIIFVMGLYLLSRGIRFRYEAVFMALPVLAAHPLTPAFEFNTRSLKYLGVTIATGVALLSMSFFHNVFGARDYYPFSTAELPVGITSFLKQVDTGGKVLNLPTYGGFLQWELGDRYSLFMDMQMILFRDTDFLMAESAFNDKDGLAGFVDRYHPAYITPALSNSNFPELIKAFPQYRLVFFDDLEALYVDSEQFPDVAEKFGLKGLDPFALQSQMLKFASYTAAERDALLAELQPMEQIYPRGRLVHQLMSLLERHQGNHQQAFNHALAIATYHPQSPTGYKLAAEQMYLAGDYAKAQELFEDALERSSGEGQVNLYRSIWLCAKKLGNHARAYSALRSAFNPFLSETSRKDIADLTHAAVESAHYREAKVFLQLLQYKTPANDKKALEEYKMLQAALDKAK